MGIPVSILTPTTYPQVKTSSFLLTSELLSLDDLEYDGDESDINCSYPPFLGYRRSVSGKSTTQPLPTFATLHDQQRQRDEKREEERIQDVKEEFGQAMERDTAPLFADPDYPCTPAQRATNRHQKLCRALLRRDWKFRESPDWQLDEVLDTKDEIEDRERWFAYSDAVGQNRPTGDEIDAVLIREMVLDPGPIGGLGAHVLEMEALRVRRALDAMLVRERRREMVEVRRADGRGGDFVRESEGIGIPNANTTTRLTNEVTQIPTHTSTNGIPSAKKRKRQDDELIIPRTIPTLAQVQVQAQVQAQAQARAQLQAQARHPYTPSPLAKELTTHDDGIQDEPASYPRNEVATQPRNEVKDSEENEVMCAGDMSRGRDMGFDDKGQGRVMRRGSRG